MIHQRPWMFRILIAGAILGLTAASAAAQAKPTPSPSDEKVVREVTLRQIRSVLGIATDDISGVTDFSQGDNGEVIIAYRYYDVDQANYETDFASEITPRIQAMYNRFKNLDRVRFQVVTNDPSGSLQWVRFSEFVIDRKTIADLHYTWFVARYILDQVLKNRR